MAWQRNRRAAPVVKPEADTFPSLVAVDDGLHIDFEVAEHPSARVPIDLSINVDGPRLGERAVSAQLLTRDRLTNALNLMTEGEAKRLGELLVELGDVSERDIARIVAMQHDLQFVDLRHVKPDAAATTLLSEVLARALCAIPLSLEEDSALVAVAEPSLEMEEDLGQSMGIPVTLAVAASDDILRTIGNSYRALSTVGAQVDAFVQRDTARRDSSRTEIVDVNDDAPVVQVVQMIITQGLRDRASDVHIEPQIDRVRVRYRIDGALHDVLDLPGSIGPALVNRVKILAGMNIVERRRPQDGQIAIQIEDRDLDIRVSTTATIWGEKIVMRLLDKSRPLFHLAELGMQPDLAEKYAELLHMPYGMVVCAGPTGSGKTTTLYGSLGEINSPERNIMTIEDPVEYVFPTINQIQINEPAGVTFAHGLRSILRQDPDIILVGEIRDAETARIAIQSALTGHLVLSSLHATDAVAALHRLLDMGIESFLVASSVTALLAQRLVRRICVNCRTDYKPTHEELVFLDLMGGSVPDTGFSHGVGCNFCAQSGYLERIGVFELMTVTPAIRELILKSASHAELRETATAEGMRSLTQDASRLVETGVTTISEILRAIYVVGE